MINFSIKRIAILGLLCSVMTVSANEAHRNLEQEEHLLMQEVEETKMRITQMRVEAMKHEAMAKQLAAEAAGLELQMHREVTRRKRDLEMAETEMKVDKMFAEAEQLERHGHHDEAHALHAKAEDIARMLHEQMRKQQERDLHQMELEIDELRELSNQAEKEGRIEEAKQAWRRADQLSEELHRHLEEREQQEEMGHMHARLGELGQAIDEAHKKGRERVVDELHEEAEALEREIHERERHMDMENTEREIHRLLEQAEQAEQQDRGDDADELRHEAGRLEDRLSDIAGEHRDEDEDRNDNDEDEDDDEDWDDEDEDEDDDESLHDEVNELREQMEGIRELMMEILDRLK